MNIDATSLDAAQRCLRYYKYRYVDGWQGKGTNPHLTFGKHYATAIERYYQYRALGMSKDDAVVNVVDKAMRETWGWVSDHNTKTRENLIRTIIWYTEQFDDEAARVLILPDGRPAVEYSFALEIDDGHVLCGHIDRVVVMGGETYIADQKTTGITLTPRYFDQFTPDNQMTLYTFAGQIIYKMPVKGVIIDAAQVAVGFTRFERGFAFRTQDSLEEWYDNLQYWIGVIEQARWNDYWPMNTQSCDKWGGCPFRGVCARSPAVRENFLSGDFEKLEPWDPLVGGGTHAVE